MKFSTSGRRMRFFLGKFQLSGKRIEIYPVDTGSFLVDRLISTLVDTNILRPEDSIQPTQEIFTTSGQRMQFLLGEFQLSGQRIEIYLAESGSYLLETPSSTMVETIISQPEYEKLSAWEKLSTSGWRMQFLWGKFELSGWRMEINLADSGSFLLKTLSSTLVETIISRPGD